MYQESQRRSYEVKWFLCRHATDSPWQMPRMISEHCDDVLQSDQIVVPRHRSKVNAVKAVKTNKTDIKNDCQRCSGW